MQGPFDKAPKSFGCCLQMAAVFRGVNANTVHLVQEQAAQEETCLKFHRGRADLG